MFEPFVEALLGLAGLSLHRKDLVSAWPGWKWEPVIAALMSLRGVQVLTAMTLAAEAGDMTRFKNPRQLMNCFGLTSSEHSSGGKRVQGGFTKCGNSHCRRVLTEAAWHYRLAIDQ